MSTTAANIIAIAIATIGASAYSVGVHQILNDTNRNTGLTTSILGLIAIIIALLMIALTDL